MKTKIKHIDAQYRICVDYNTYGFEVYYAEWYRPATKWRKAKWYPVQEDTFENEYLEYHWYCTRVETLKIEAMIDWLKYHLNKKIEDKSTKSVNYKPDTVLLYIQVNNGKIEETYECEK